MDINIWNGEKVITLDRRERIILHLAEQLPPANGNDPRGAPLTPAGMAKSLGIPHATAYTALRVMSFNDEVVPLAERYTGMIGNRHAVGNQMYLLTDKGHQLAALIRARL